MRSRRVAPSHVGVVGFPAVAARLLDWLLSRHRASAVLVACYLSLFSHIWNEFSGPSSTESVDGNQTEEVLDPEVLEPLTRSSVLARARALSSKDGEQAPRPTMFRRETTGKSYPEISSADPGCSSELEDAAASLEWALMRTLPSAPAEARAALVFEGDGLCRSHSGLIAMRSSRGQYEQALRAAQIALEVIESSGSEVQVVIAARIAVGNMELRHHRYSEAEQHFQAALRLPQFDLFALRAEAFLGSGWAALLRKDMGLAEEHLAAALQELGSTHKNRSICEAVGDGLDEHRATAAALLSVVNHRLSESPVDVSIGSFARSLRSGCADQLLEPGFSGEGRAFANPKPRLAFALAEIVQGRADLATRHLMKSRSHGQDPCIPGRGLIDLPRCALDALFFALTSYVGLRHEGGNSWQLVAAGHVYRLFNASAVVVKGRKAQAEVRSEVVEWLMAFAQAQSWPSLGTDFSSFLMTRAEQLVTDDAKKLARNAAARGRLLLSAKPAEAAVLLRRALALGFPDRVETASLHSDLGSVLLSLGQANGAVENFLRALAFDLAEIQANSAAAASGHALLKRAASDWLKLGVAQMSIAGRSDARWRQALGSFRQARVFARSAGLGPQHDLVVAAQEGLQAARSLAQERGALGAVELCPGRRSALLASRMCPALPTAR